MFRENLGLRIFSLIIAVFIWLQAQLVTEHRSVVELPVNLKSVPKNITLERLPQSIPFQVRGKGFDLIKLKLSRTKVTIDASKIQPGEDIISLTDYSIDLPDNINITLLGPAVQKEIAVRADVFYQKKVPVQLGYADTFTRQRFTNLKYQINPDRVIVFGPRTKVLAIESALTEAITREMLTERDFILKLATTGEDVSFSETQVRVRVSNSFNTSRIFDNLNIITDSGISCFPSRATVKLSGDSEMFKQFDPSLIKIKVAKEADVKGLHALIAEVPEGVELVAITPDKVRIK